MIDILLDILFSQPHVMLKNTFKDLISALLIDEILLGGERTNTGALWWCWASRWFRKQGKSSQTDFAVPSKWTVSLNRALA